MREVERCRGRAEATKELMLTAGSLPLKNEAGGSGLAARRAGMKGGA